MLGHKEPSLSGIGLCPPAAVHARPVNGYTPDTHLHPTQQAQPPRSEDRPAKPAKERAASPHLAGNSQRLHFANGHHQVMVAGKPEPAAIIGATLKLGRGELNPAPANFADCHHSGVRTRGNGPVWSTRTRSLASSKVKFPVISASPPGISSITLGADCTTPSSTIARR